MRAVAAEGQRTLVAQQDDRLLGELAGDRAVGVEVEVDRAPGDVLVRVVDRVGQHRRQRPTSRRRAGRARPSARAPAGPPGRRAPTSTQPDTDGLEPAARRSTARWAARRRRPRPARWPGGLGRTAGHARAAARGRRRRSSRRRRCPRSPTCRAAALVSKRVVGGRRHAVDVGVGVHHRAGAALAYGHLERRQQHVGDLSRPGRHRREVAAGAGRGVADEVLESRDDAGTARARGRRRCRRRRRGTGPRRWSPRPGPSGSRGRRRAPARDPGARRPSASRRRCARPSARPGRGRRSPPRPAAPGRSSHPRSAKPARHSSWARPGCRTATRRRSPAGYGPGRGRPAPRRRAPCRRGG